MNHHFKHTAALLAVFVTFSSLLASCGKEEGFSGFHGTNLTSKTVFQKSFGKYEDFY